MYEYEKDSEIIGAHCTLLTPYKGYSEGTVVGDFGNKIVVRLSRHTCHQRNPLYGIVETC